MDPEKFAKVLALVDSEHHGESKSALRAARIMLARAGLSFRDLADLARQPAGWLVVPEAAPIVTPPPPSSAVTVAAQDDALRRQLRSLETQVRELEATVERQRRELARQGQEVTRWHKLAQETAERLWDVGKALESHHSRIKATDKRRALIDLLCDPAIAAWSNREIARQTGTTAHAVKYWRWRLALAERTRRESRGLPRARRLYRRLTNRYPRDGIRDG